MQLGLAWFRTNRQGTIEVDMCWALDRLLDRASASADEVIETLAGARQPAHLSLDDFAHVEDAEFPHPPAARGGRQPHVRGERRDPRAARYRQDRAGTHDRAGRGLALHGVGEADEEGQEPSRWDRVTALRLAQRIIGRSGNAMLLFDEMEDMIGDARPSDGDWIARREGSKLFVNRLLETNAVPVIWTTNAIGNVDAAILRRMSFVLKLDLPSPATTRRIVERIATEEGVAIGPRLNTLIDIAPETPTVLRVAARAARLAGEEDGGARSAHALVRAMRGADLPPPIGERLDLDLFETDVALDALIGRIAESNAQDVSFLLAGPPGTGKTALAHHLARALDRPLMVRRASDLLSRWIGGTEAAIAKAFGDARQQGSLLLLDEVDSLLFDRASARTSWEVGQVNEMLTWLDHHPLPVVAATNHRHRLDPAALRRFVFKLDLRPLGRERAEQAFERFFGRPAPRELATLDGLTPGDFAVVARQMRHAPIADADMLVAHLRSELQTRPGPGGRIGF